MVVIIIIIFSITIISFSYLSVNNILVNNSTCTIKATISNMVPLFIPTYMLSTEILLSAEETLFIPLSIPRLLLGFTSVVDAKVCLKLSLKIFLYYFSSWQNVIAVDVPKRWPRGGVRCCIHFEDHSARQI